MIVMKFGGSSLASVDRIRTCCSLVRAEVRRSPVVVVSACGKTTDELLRAANDALRGVVSVQVVSDLHHVLAGGLGVDTAGLDALMNELAALLEGVHLLGELTPRTLDRILSYGERLSAHLFAAVLRKEALPSSAVAAYDLGLVTDDRHGCASPLPGIEAEIARSLGAVEGTPVVTGFLGRTQDGHITTLGRSGSDFSASLLGAAISADEVQIWTDVDGVMTCDPSLDPRAENLPALSFDEASELAYYGAEVLHPSTIVPAIRRDIPVRVCNTMRPQGQGTRIARSSARGGRIAKSVVYKEGVCLITIATPRLMSAVRVLAKAFSTLERHDVGIHLATTSEATVSLVTDRPYPEDVLAAAASELRDLGDVEVERGKAVVCVVGEELRGQVGALSKIFGVVAARGIKARMVSQSASELNVALLVDEAEIEPTVLGLHELLLSTPRSTRSDQRPTPVIER